MNRRNAYQDYRAPAFYMITMTTLARRPLILSAYPTAERASDRTLEKCLAMNAWCEQIADAEGD